MPILKSFLSLVLIFILAILTLGFFLPKEEKVIAVKQINCPVEKVFAQVNDLQAWSAWSAWDRYDPAMSKKYSAITVGKGANYSWSGNWKVGKGEMSITESLPNEKINTLLNYNYEGTTQGGFEFRPNETGTEVRWWISIEYSSNPLIKRFFGGYGYVMMNYFLQKDFGLGLENLSQNCK